MNYQSIEPSLEHIERALFGPSDALLQCWAETPDQIPADLRASLEKDDAAIQMRNSFLSQERDATDDIASSDHVDGAAMPLFLQQAVKRHVEVQHTDFGSLPQAGQIVSVAKIDGPHGSLGWDLPRPHAVLLSESTDHPDIWYGWLVAPESLYASEWDFVIQEDNGTAAPFASVVQLWNPVHLYLRNVGSVIGQLNSDAMYAVRMLGMHMITNDPLPVMGQAGAWVMRQIEEHTIITGADIVTEDDPRVYYQQLYAHAAVAVKEPARLVAAEPSLWSQLLSAMQQSFAEFGEILVPQPRVAMAMGESDAQVDTAYQLGAFPLKVHLSSEDESILQVAIIHQAGGEPCEIMIQDESEMPIFEDVLDDNNPAAKMSIPMTDVFSLHIVGQTSHKKLTVNPSAIDE